MYFMSLPAVPPFVTQHEQKLENERENTFILSSKRIKPIWKPFRLLRCLATYSALGGGRMGRGEWMDGFASCPWVLQALASSLLQLH